MADANKDFPLRKIVGLRYILECGHAERVCWVGRRTKLNKRASRCYQCYLEREGEIEQLERVADHARL